MIQIKSHNIFNILEGGKNEDKIMKLKCVLPTNY